MTSTTFLKKLRSANYRLLGLVGQGQFGQVYCAIHRKTGRLVALKNLNRDRFPTHQFLRELRFLLSLNHPHIANCLALEQSANGRQLVLDYCEGGTLRDLLEQETQLTLSEILTLMTEVLEALEHAQRAKIVHCDIKPENILLTLTPDGWQAKVSDFGIARLSQEFQGDRSGATGSPAYMAPERFYHQYSVSSDLYAIGVVLYELLLGDRPFSGNYDQLMVAHLNHAVKIPETLPTGVRSLLGKSMEKLMARRFHSAAAMKSAIAAARTKLTASELRERFPKPLSPVPHCRFIAPGFVALPQPCDGLSIIRSTSDQPMLMAHAGDRLWRWSISDEGAIAELGPWHLPAPVQRLRMTAQGAIAVTDQALYRLLPAPSPQPFVTFEEAVQGVLGGHRWMIVQTQAAPHQFRLIDTCGKVPQQPHKFEVPAHSGKRLSLFDDRYLLLADVVEQKTHLYVLSRWGKPYGRLVLNSPLHQLVPSNEARQVLAQAGPQGRDLLMIQLKPYRVTRCRLDITADWVGQLVIGIAAVSKDGRLRIINTQGQLIGQVDNLPVPQAIAFQPPYQVWLTSKQAAETRLYCIDIRNLDLDILF